MGGGYFTEAGIFLIRVVFGFYILMVMLRFLLQTVRADFYNPISQFIVKITSPTLNPLRRFIPGIAGIDIAAIVLLLLLQFIELLIISSIANSSMHPGILLIISVKELLTLMIYIFIIAIIIQAIMSWIQPGGYNPVLSLIYQITEPLLGPVRRMLPPMSGLDLSPLLVIVVLYLIVMAIPYLLSPLLQLFQ